MAAVLRESRRNSLCIEVTSEVLAEIWRWYITYACNIYMNDRAWGPNKRSFKVDIRYSAWRHEHLPQQARRKRIVSKETVKLLQDVHYAAYMLDIDSSSSIADEERAHAGFREENTQIMLCKKPWAGVRKFNGGSCTDCFPSREIYLEPNASIKWETKSEILYRKTYPILEEFEWGNRGDEGDCNPDAFMFFIFTRTQKADVIQFMAVFCPHIAAWWNAAQINGPARWLWASKSGPFFI